MQGHGEKLNELHVGEEFLRSKAQEFIDGNEDMFMHIAVIEKAMDVLNMFSTEIHDDENEDDEAVRLLGMRLFNGCAAAFQLTVSGYYQAAGMLMRDLLETVFLLDYFDLDHTKIHEWRVADRKTRLNTFKPAKIRTALDERDKFTSKKRNQEYQLLCELAAHPTYQGFQLLAPRGRQHHCGPFFDSYSLTRLIEHLAKLAIQAGEKFGLFFDPKTKGPLTVKLDFLELRINWCERYWKIDYDRTVINEARKLLDSM